MSIPTPTTKEVAENIVAQLEAELNQTIPLLPKGFNRVLAQALAAVLMIVYKFAGWMFLQMFVATAQNRTFTINGRQINPLVEWGLLVGAGHPEPATQAELTASVTVITQSGQLPAGTQLVGVNNGVTYLTTTNVLLDAPTVTINAKAVSDQSGGGGAGVIGNLPVGSILTFANSQPLVNQTTIVMGATVTGANAESTDDYRQRVINLFQARPQGGAYVDYGIWGLEPEGIKSIYPYTGDPGQVDVYVESATEVDGIPSGPQLTAVYNSIQLDQSGLATRRPANAFVNVYPITRTSFNVDVFGITGVDDLVQTRNEIEQALIEYFLSREPFIPGYTLGVNNGRILQTSVSSIVNTIVSSHGGEFGNAVVKMGATPITTWALNEGQKAKLGLLAFL